MDKKRYVEGLIMAIIAFTIWGLLPLYWKLVNAITPYEIFSQRVVWSFLFVMIVIALKGNFVALKNIIKEANNWLKVIGSAVFISINWLTYIWSVNNGYVIETSLGYYINPLVLTLFGAIFFKEKLDRLQKIGIGFAATGVVLKAIMYGQIPFVSLVLAFTFAIYGLLKKKSHIDSLNGLAFETLIVGVPALIYLVSVESSGQGIVGNLKPSFWFLIALSGIVTAVPLLLYAEGTKRLPLNIVGFLQYIAPTIALILGIYVFKEPFDTKAMFPFVFIWIGLGIFSYSQYKLLSQK